MKKLLSVLALAFALLGSPAHAAGQRPADMTASGAIAGSQLVWCPIGTTSDLKCTFTQVAAYVYSLANGDCTITGVGAVVCTKTNGTNFSALATTAPGTGVATALAVNIGSAGAVVVNGGALGTPSSGVATNLTGTASGLTAGNVTTNANLTGAVTSAGNATSLGSFTAAQLLAAVATKTGTGLPMFGTLPDITTGFTIGGAAASGNYARGDGSKFASSAIQAGDLPLATTGAFGAVKPDGSTITIAAGVISAATGGGGTVTSVSAGCGTSTGGSPITTTGTILAAVTSRTNATTSDPIVAADCGNKVVENNASTITVGIAQAGTAGFPNGFFTQVCNIGAGTANITPTTSTIGGASSYALPGGAAAAPVCVSVYSNGTNYDIAPEWMTNASLLGAGTVAAARMPALTGDVTTSAGSVATTLAAGSASNLNSGTLAAARGGAGTINGALKGNGSGVVSQAACADLSNGTALCSTTPGSGVATAAGTALSAAGGLTTTIASGTAAMGTGAIGSAACASVVTVAATNVATTDVLAASFNGDPTAVTGYVPLTTGMLTIIPYPTSGNVNFKVCNNTGGTITPGAITLNYRVTR